MSDHVYRVTEIVGSSSKSSDDAIRNALDRAKQTLRNLEWFEVIGVRGHIENGAVGHFQVTVKVGFRLDDAGMSEPGASYLLYDQIDWAVEGASAPAKLVALAKETGARRKRMATGQAGFFMNHSEMPAGFTVPTHTHDHDEMLVILDGGCTILDGGPTLGTNDAVVIQANHAYGFTCGPDGMKFITIRNGEAATALNE